MPIVTLSTRMAEVGRIRIGKKGAKGAPVKLDVFRLTSSNRTALEAAAQAYGGTVEEWKGAPTTGQFELITESAELDVVLPPGDQALSQWLEHWSGGGCQRRCDGVTEQLSQRPCLCAATGEQLCKPTTRLNVLLSKVPGLGVWRLESHGHYAASELAAAVAFLDQAGSNRGPLEATLRLEQRVSKSGGKTQKFAVPVLDIGLTLGQAQEALSRQPGIPAIGSGEEEEPTGELLSPLDAAQVIEAYERKGFGPEELAVDVQAVTEGRTDDLAMLLVAELPSLRTVFSGRASVASQEGGS